MSPRPESPPGGGPAARPWPAALLGALLPAALIISGYAGARSWWLIPWGVAAAAATAAFLLRRLRDRAEAEGEAGAQAEARAEFRLLLLGVAGTHLGVAAAGLPAAGPAAYAVILLLAAARLPGWWRLLACWAAVAALEGGLRLLERFAPRPGVAPPSPADGAALLAALGVLGLFAFLAGRLFRRCRAASAALQDQVDEHRRLRSHAEEYRALDGHRGAPAAADLSPRGKDTRVMSAVVGLDGDLDRLLDLARQALGARGAFLFLRGEDADLLPLRRSVVPKEGPKVDPAAAVRIDVGIAGHAARTRRPALFTDLAPGSLRPAIYAGGVLSPSVVVVPVQEDGVFRGLLLAEGPDPGAFGREHEHLLEGFAGAVGALLESARGDARRERRSHRFEALGRLSTELSTSIKLDEVLRRILERTGHVVPFDRGAIFLADRAGGRLVLGAERGFGVPEGEEREIAWDHGLPGHIAAHGRPMLFTDLKERERGVDVLPGSEGQEKIRSFLGTPLRGQEGLVGVWVIAADEPGRFGAEDLEMLQFVAAQAAVVISNATLHQEVERMAVTDGLTGLFNHRHFQERLGNELERAARTGEAVSLLLMDIDHFKKVNDTYGHPFGDRVLKALAAELRKLARRVDVVARYGGEEFALVLVSTDRRGCRTTVERVLKAVRAVRIPHEGGVFTFTASIGSATCPDDAKSREELVRRADQALYAAKAGGRNCARAAGELASL